jgi:hypothetical protein
MKHDITSATNSQALYAQIKNMEYDLMYNKKTFYTLSDLEALTRKYLDITKPIDKPHNFNSNQNLI